MKAEKYVTIDEAKKIILRLVQIDQDRGGHPYLALRRVLDDERCDQFCTVAEAVKASRSLTTLTDQSDQEHALISADSGKQDSGGCGGYWNCFASVNWGGQFTYGRWVEISTELQPEGEDGCIPPPLLLLEAETGTDGPSRFLNSILGDILPEVCAEGFSLWEV